MRAAGVDSLRNMVALVVWVVDYQGSRARQIGGLVSQRTKTAHTLAGSVNKKAEMVWSSSWGCPLENKRNHQGCPGTLGPLGSQESPVGPGLGLAALAPKLGGGGLGGGTNLCWTLGWSSCIITGLGGKNSPPWKSSCGLSSGSNMCRARKLTRSYLCCT